MDAWIVSIYVYPNECLVGVQDIKSTQTIPRLYRPERMFSVVTGILTAINVASAIKIEQRALRKDFVPPEVYNRNLSKAVSSRYIVPIEQLRDRDEQVRFEGRVMDPCECATSQFSRTLQSRCDVEQYNLFRGSFFMKNVSRMWTCESLNAAAHSKIDNMLTNRKWSLLDVSVVDAFRTGSRHRSRDRAKLAFRANPTMDAWIVSIYVYPNECLVGVQDIKSTQTIPRLYRPERMFSVVTGILTAINVASAIKIEHENEKFIHLIDIGAAVERAKPIDIRKIVLVSAKECGSAVESTGTYTPSFEIAAVYHTDDNGVIDSGAALQGPVLEDQTSGKYHLVIGLRPRYVSAEYPVFYYYKSNILEVEDAKSTSEPYLMKGEGFMFGTITVKVNGRMDAKSTSEPYLMKGEGFMFGTITVKVNGRMV
ncbi:hypothetical protein OSTOST_02058, partial [Ostertagia ostertagi]